MGIFDQRDSDSWELSEVRELGWRELELMIGTALELKGYEVEVTRPVKDEGVDVDADKIDILRSILFRPKLVPRKRRLIVDAKQWSDPVGSNPVSEIADTADKKGGTGVIASPSGFYEPAKKLAEKKSVKLYDGDRIVELFSSTEVEVSDIE